MSRFRLLDRQLPEGMSRTRTLDYDSRVGSNSGALDRCSQRTQSSTRRSPWASKLLGLKQPDFTVVPVRCLWI